MTHRFEDCPHPESLRARSCAMQHLFEETGIDAVTGEKVVTIQTNPGVTAVLEEVIHDFVYRLLND
jgi:hypothetical protein